MWDFNKKKYGSGFTLCTFILQLFYFCCNAFVTVNSITDYNNYCKILLYFVSSDFPKVALVLTSLIYLVFWLSLNYSMAVPFNCDYFVVLFILIHVSRINWAICLTCYLFFVFEKQLAFPLELKWNYTHSNDNFWCILGGLKQFPALFKTLLWY